jgi:hypothetical protein
MHFLTTSDAWCATNIHDMLYTSDLYLGFNMMNGFMRIVIFGFIIDEYLSKHNTLDNSNADTKYQI